MALPRLGIDVTFVEGVDPDDFRAAIGPNTKALYVESIANPGFVVPDLDAGTLREGDDVEGALVKPDEANISGEQHSKTSSLIRIRQDFIPEMLKSVEDI